MSFRIDQDLKKELATLKEQADLSAADILRAGLGKCAPMAGEAFNKGYLTALADLYEVVCLECEDRVLFMCPDPPD